MRSRPMTADPEDDREEDDRRHDVVGQRIERVRRNIEIDEVEGRPALEERGAEERRRLGRREGQRHEHRERQAHDPERDQHGAGAQAEPARVRSVERPEALDDRDRDVGQDRHLEQLDEAVRRPLERRARARRRRAPPGCRGRGRRGSVEKVMGHGEAAESTPRAPKSSDLDLLAALPWPCASSPRRHSRGRCRRARPWRCA